MARIENVRDLVKHVDVEHGTKYVKAVIPSAEDTEHRERLALIAASIVESVIASKRKQFRGSIPTAVFLTDAIEIFMKKARESGKPAYIQQRNPDEWADVMLLIGINLNAVIGLLYQEEEVMLPNSTVAGKFFKKLHEYLIQHKVDYPRNK